MNDFYKIESWHKELRPLSYWVDDGGMGYQGSNYMDCLNWIKDNYLNSYKLEKWWKRYIHNENKHTKENKFGTVLHTTDYSHPIRLPIY